jgi:hypothetical protein
MGSLARYSTLLLAAILAGPALWHGFVVRDMDVDTAIIRFLIAVLVSAFMLAFLRGITSDYRKPKPVEKKDEDESANDLDSSKRRTEDSADGDSRVDKN